MSGVRLLLLSALLLTAACGGGTTAQPAAPTPTPVVTTRAPVPTKAPAYQVVTATTNQTFTSPDGNLGCVVEPAYARCDFVKRDFALPPAPSDCSSGWGHGIELQAGTKAGFFCGSDFVTGSKNVIAVGRGIRVGFVECDVVRAGEVACHGTSDAHGFRVSRARYSLA